MWRWRKLRGWWIMCNIYCWQVEEDPHPGAGEVWPCSLGLAGGCAPHRGWPKSYNRTADRQWGLHTILWPDHFYGVGIQLNLVPVVSMLLYWIVFQSAIQLTTQEINLYHLESSVDEPLLVTSCSYSCAIEDGEEVVLTGGEDEDSSGESSVTTVTRYNMQGQTTTLPSLNTGRSYHACGTIKKSDGTTVRAANKLLCHTVILSSCHHVITSSCHPVILASSCHHINLASCHSGTINFQHCHYPLTNWLTDNITTYNLQLTTCSFISCREGDYLGGTYWTQRRSWRRMEAPPGKQ